MNGGNYHCSSVTALTRVKLTSDYPTSPPSVQPLCWRHIRESFGRNVRYELDYGQVGNASIGRHRHLSFSTVCSKVERRGSRKCPTMTHRQRRARLCYRNSTAQHAVVFRNVAQLSLFKMYFDLEWHWTTFRIHSKLQRLHVNLCFICYNSVNTVPKTLE